MDPALGLSPLDVHRMPIGLVWQALALSEQTSRLRDRMRRMDGAR